MNTRTHSFSTLAGEKSLSCLSVLNRLLNSINLSACKCFWLKKNISTDAIYPRSKLSFLGSHETKSHDLTWRRKHKETELNLHENDVLSSAFCGGLSPALLQCVCIYVCNKWHFMHMNLPVQYFSGWRLLDMLNISNDEQHYLGCRLSVSPWAHSLCPLASGVSLQPLPRPPIFPFLAMPMAKFPFSPCVPESASLSLSHV